MSFNVERDGGSLRLATVVVAKPNETVLNVVASSPGANEIAGPISAGTPVTIPDSVTYEDTDLQVFLNGQQLDSVSDFNYEGTGTRTQVSFTFELIEGDNITFRVD